MTAARVLLILAGLGLAGYGATLLWDNPTPILIRIVVWALAGVVLHDFVFAPICAAFGLVGRRLLPPRWQVPVAVALLCGVVLGLLAVPVVGKPGMRPDNLTVLDRDYPLGLLLSLSVVLLALLWYLLGVRLLPVRQDEVVEQQRAEYVERQPPAV
jgi:uncharacterized integral membrane protein